MQIEISTDNHIDGDEELIQRLSLEVENGLSHFADQLTRVEVHLSDENAGKSGPADKRCVLEARPEGLPPVAVSHQAATVDAALSGATKKLRNLLDTQRGRRDDRKGGPTVRQERPS